MSSVTLPYDTGEWVDTTSDNDETIDSKEFRSFIWRERPDSEKYDRGQLIVVFHTTGAYTYDVTADVFVEMAERAYYTDEYDETPFQWYDENMVECVKDEVSDSDGPLYTDKLNL